MIQTRTFTEDATYRWTARSLQSIRRAMEANAVHELLPAVLSDEIEAGGLHSVAILADTRRMRRPTPSNPETHVSVREDNTFYLPLSHNFEKQQAVEFLTPNYSIVPCVRPLEPHEWHSNKHLFTFFEIEIEMRTESQGDVWGLTERLLTETAASLEHAVGRGELADAGAGRRHRDSVAKGRFEVITFAEALDRVGARPGRETDLTPDEDRRLCEQFEAPFWIHDYPRPVRGTVFHENAHGRYESFDLMLPFGYGELATGGVRPKTGEQILAQSLDVIKESPATLTRGHADWKTARGIQSAGLGIGLERLVRFLSGAGSVLDVIQPHDRGPNRKLLAHVDQ